MCVNAGGVKRGFAGTADHPRRDFARNVGMRVEGRSSDGCRHSNSNLALYNWICSRVVQKARPGKPCLRPALIRNGNSATQGHCLPGKSNCQIKEPEQTTNG